MYETFAGKSAIILAASPGAMGGMRNLNPHRTLLNNLGVNVLATSVAIGRAFEAFDENGDLKDGRQANMLHHAVESLYVIARDAANRETVCKMLRERVVGEYGSISIPEASETA
jgi:NAD(P)H-dependent FMN reductase